MLARIVQVGVLCALGLVAAGVGPAQEEPLKGWTYTCGGKPLGDKWADPAFDKLNDGDRSPDKSAIFGGGTIAVDIALPRATALNKIVTHVYRHNNNYKLRQVTVEALQAGQYVEVGKATEGFWGPTEQRAFALEVPLAVSAEKLRVNFHAASIVSIQEIEIFGAVAAAATEGTYALPVNDAPGAHVSEVDADGDGKKEIILENPLVRLIFEPDGGVCRSMLLKDSQSELVGGTGRYGLLRDQLWSPNYSFAARFYFATTGEDREGAWVELKTQGIGGMLSFTEITKRVHLGPDSPIVRVHYSLKNDPSSQTDYAYGFWAHHFLGVRGQDATYFFPTTDGVVEQRFKAGEPLEVWHYNPARGWAAYVADSGVGLAATVEYKRLNCFYMWAGAGTAIPTFEWRYNRVPVNAGQTFETDVSLVPVAGLKRVDGVVGDIVGAIEKGALNAQSVTASLYRPPGSESANVVLQARALPEGTWQEVGRTTLTENSATLSADVSGINAPVGVVRCTISRGGEELGFLERPLAWGDVKLAYRLEPLEEREGETGPADVKQHPGHDLSTEVETPHFRWARPYYRGPIKALVLCDDRYSREVIELWQRLEMDFEYVKFYTTLDKEWLYHGDRSILTLDAAQKRLAEKLQQNYDVIVLSGLKWDHHFTPELRQTIAAKIQDGTGLVYIEPDGLKPEDELDGVCGEPDGESRTLGWWGKWAPTVEHYITSGLPWELLPRTRRMPFLEPPPGDVLATIAGREEQPLIVAGQLGDGRVLTLTYDTLTHVPSYRGYAALTPAISYRGNYLQRDEMAAITWQYWEHWWALLCRCAVWAAQKDSGLRFESLAAADGKALTGRLLGKLPPGAQVDVVFRDRFSAEVARAQAAPQAQGDGAALSVPLPDTLRAGTCFADLVLRDAEGASVAWASAAFDGPAGPKLKQVSVGNRTVLDTEALWSPDQPWKRAFRPETPLRLVCEVDVPQPAAAPATLAARLIDCHGRLVSEQTQPAGPGATTITFEASPTVLYNIGHRWDVELRAGDRVWDTGHAELIVLPPRDWRKFTFTSWGGQYLWRCQYLFDYLRPRVEDLGLDIAMNGTNEINTGKVWWDYWQNIGHTFLGVLSYMGRDVPQFMDRGFAQKSAEFAKTNDKQFLVREPCLHDPEYLAELTAAISDFTMPHVEEFGGAYDYCMGDEMSLTHYTRYYDFCFGEHSLAAFREWLQKRYDSLDALNQAWETQFADWGAVMPMTLEEVKGRANAAPWAEFRDFMNDSLADYYALVQGTIRETDPDAKCGLSGTQEPKPGNGMDWWQNSQAFSYYHSYNTGWSDEMRRSFQPYTGVMCTPYRCGYWQSGQRLEYQNFWCLLHDTKGISAWTTPLFFYGDFTYSEAGRDTRANMRELKAGLWDLIRSAQRQHDGIAIHYSHPSINAALLMDKDGEIVQIRDAWVKLIEDLGLQYNFVSYRQIEDGILNAPEGDHERYKVLVLPESIALSPKEVAEIKQFVRSGGGVLGDMCIGLMDDKCRRQQQGLLDEVFGIQRQGEDQPLPVGVAVQDVPDVIKLPAGEATVQAKGATARGRVPETDVPAVLVNRYGEGAAAYLNINLAQFENERRFATPTERGMGQVLLKVLEEFDVQPPYHVTLESGKVSHIEVIRYAAAPLEYLGLLRSSADEGGEVAKIALGGRRHVYDVRSGTYLGEIDTITAPMLPGDCRVYCLARAPLGEVSLEASATGGRGGQIRYTLKPQPGNAGEKQLVRIVALRPDGGEAEDYARNYLVGAEPIDGAIQLALNDPAGQWRLQARGLCTGKVAQAAFQVTE